MDMCQEAITTITIEGAAATERSRVVALSVWLISAALAAMFLLSFVCRATAAPPPNAALTYQHWFESLEQPGERHLLCCSIADCHFATARATNVGYEVAIENSWVVVPSDRILQRVSNPTGHAVVCYRHIFDIEHDDHADIIRIFCFVRPPDV
jgi:hypothetical protein